MKSDKDKIQLDSFLRLFYSEIINIKSYTYDDFLYANTNVVFTKEKFDIFNNNTLNLRLMLINALLNDNKIAIEVNASDQEFNEISGRACVYAFNDNGYSPAEIEYVLGKFSSEYMGFSEYIQTIEQKQILKNGFVFYVCLYYSLKLKELYDNHEMVTALLIKNNKDLVRSVFNEIYNTYNLILIDH